MHHLGFTRSSLKADHLLQTPDTFVRTPLPGADGVEFIVHAAPQLGAGFTQMTAEFADGGTLGPAPAQRFLYVLEGELQLETETGGHVLASAVSRFCRKASRTPSAGDAKSTRCGDRKALRTEP